MARGFGVAGSQGRLDPDCELAYSDSMNLKAGFFYGGCSAAAQRLRWNSEAWWGLVVVLVGIRPRIRAQRPGRLTSALQSFAMSIAKSRRASLDVPSFRKLLLRWYARHQ